MNELNLPQHCELPDDVRDRIRTAVHADADSPAARTVRWRAPLAVAAGVAALVAATVVVVLPVDDLQTGSQPPVLRSGDLTLTQPDTRTDADLDRCAEVVAASPQAHKYTPRETWVPVFTVRRDVSPTTVPGTAEPTGTEVTEVRVVAFRQGGDKPVFCTFRGDWIMLSDPDSEPITMAKNDRADIYVVSWLMPDPILVGVAQGVTAMDGRVVPSHDPSQISTTPAPLVQDGLFAMEAGISTGDRVEVVGYRAGETVVSGGRAFDQSIEWLAGASTTER
jgi:hypothetical protein